MPASRWTPQQKAEALAIYVEHGTAEAHRRTGIPKGTLSSWARREGVKTVASVKTKAAGEAAAARAARLREELRLRMLEKAHDALDRMDEAHKDFRGKDADEVWWDKAPSGAMKDYATVMAILVDKYRLEVGEATARSEVSTVSEVDRELERLAAELRSRAGGTVPVAVNGKTPAGHA